MGTLISHSPGETEALGESWARELGTAWVIGLEGVLGAGKTHLVRGLARGWGVRQRVHSPTFALLHSYRGEACSVYHLDLYRLETAEEVLAAGLEEYLVRPGGPSVVEWYERWAGDSTSEGRLWLPDAPRRCRRVWLRVAEGDEREIRYEDFGF